MDIFIETMKAKHWPSVRTIYQEGIEGGNATFETAAPDWESWDQAHLKDGRLVARVSGLVVGFAMLSKVSGRCVYAGVVEVSVYVATSAQGHGVGTKLLKTLVARSEEMGFWTLQASMFPENVASLALHRSCGFRQVGRRERIGQLDGKWRDTLLLERRSSKF